jgi:hypothetical protein
MDSTDPKEDLKRYFMEMKSLGEDEDGKDGATEDKMMEHRLPVEPLERLGQKIRKGFLELRGNFERRLIFKTRSYLLLLGLVIVYYLSLDDTGNHAEILGFLGFLNGFAGAWVGRLRTSIGRPRFYVYIGKAFRLFFKYLYILLPTDKFLISKCEGEACKLSMNILDKVVEKGKVFVRAVAGKPRNALALVPVSDVPGATPYSLDHFQQTVDRVCAFWLMLTLLAVLVKGQTKPSNTHLVGAAIQLRSFLKLFKDLAEVSSVSGIVSGLAEALPSLYALFTSLASRAVSKIPGLERTLEQDTDLYFPAVPLGTIHTSLIIVSIFAAVIFTFFTQFLRR